MKRFLFLLLILSLGFSSFVVVGQDEGYPNEPYLTDYDAGTFVPDLCPFYILPPEIEEETVQCGYLIVPENRQMADSRNIQLAVMVIYGKNPGSDPVVYLEGGPGGSAISAYDFWYTSSLRDSYDIILIDQRGTGFSLPSLNCYETDDPDIEDPTAACAERLRDEGVDLSAYNTNENANDVADLLESLDIEQANLYGTSYGTRLALTVVRERPERIRSVMIEGVYPPNVDAYDEQAVNFYYSLQRLFDACANSACNDSYPELDLVFYETIDSLNDTPLELEDPDTGDIVDFTGDDLVNDIFQDMYDAAMIPYIPSLIYAAYEGDAEAYSSIGPEGAPEVDPSDEYQQALNNAFMDYLGYDDYDTMYEYLDSLSDDDYYAIQDTILGVVDDDSEGMFNSVDCYEEMPFNSMDKFDTLSQDVPPEITGAIALSVETTMADCKVWDIPSAGAIENEPVSTDIPVLVFSGEFDPITPQEWGDVTMQSLSNAHHFIFPGLGHGAFDIADCPTQIGLAFLANPTETPDASCIDDMQAVFNTDY